VRGHGRLVKLEISMETPLPSSKETRREREFERRRQEIMSAARTLFITKGLRNTTLDEIAETSAFGKGTIYNYFTSKDDLFHAIIDQLIEETFSANRAAIHAAPDNARAKLLAYALSSVSHFEANNEVFLMIMREQNQLTSEMISKFMDRYREKLSMVSEPIQSGMQSGEIQTSDPKKLAAMFDGMIRTYCLMTSQGLWVSDHQSPADVAEWMVSVLFDGIANPQNQG
jgi:AcrR family transcriptional regulator